MSTPTAESRSAYSDPIPPTRIMSACCAHPRRSAVAIPVRSETTLLPLRVDACSRRDSVVLTFDLRSFVAFRCPIDRIEEIDAIYVLPDTLVRQRIRRDYPDRGRRVKVIAE